MPVMAEPESNAQQEIRGRRILVVHQPKDGFYREHYVIHLMMEQWRGWGFTVEVTDRIGAAPVASDVVIPHLDTTRTPVEYSKWFERCGVVLNRKVTDISKRLISKNLLSRPSEYDGPVIVKTDCNFGGQAEWQSLNDSGRLAQLAMIVARRLPWTLTGMAAPYKIFERASLVPRAAWRNRRLVVEKFLPERQDGMYCLRQYTFFGNAEINTRAFSADPIVKARTMVKREILPETPAEIREIRKALGFDYGKFDYVVHEDGAVLFDANRTPAYSPSNAAGPVKPLIIGLAKGIYGFCS